MISVDAMEWFALIEHVILTVFMISLVSVFVSEGWPGIARITLIFLKTLPGFQHTVDMFVKREVNDFVKQLREEGGKSKKELEKTPPRVTLPEKGISADILREEMTKINKNKIKTDAGKIFALVYTMDDDNFKLQKDAYDMFTQKSGVSVKHDALVKEFHHAFMHENALNPMMFPSLRRFETEIVSMCADMLNGDEKVVGSLTSGGTESILMAVKTYRDRARKLYPDIVHPEMVAPITIHPAFEKAAHYFNLTIVHVPIDDDFRVNVDKYKQAVTKNTVALLASATQYCHGVVDPIEEIAAIATETGIPFHVDACFGGFMLPWVEKLGYPVPKFDFRLDGVTSMSADLHKYGYTSKGSSVVLYRNAEIRKYQIFAYGGWPGGLFGSPSMAGTRPGGNIAASWVALRHLGKDGYLKMAKSLMKITKKLTDGIKKIPGLKILGDPSMTCFAIAASDPSLDLLAVADVMETKGWKMERQQFPTSIHCTILPQHLSIADQLLADFADATKKVLNGEVKSLPSASSMYGMLAKIPDKAIVNDVIVEFFSEIYKQ
ncbi:sphingosine-1-phosphate lyase-like [Saccoglossus kowalevskii]|uniref:Sphingosine-1-phosphate lyase-like n=1 Tax=Saccoglossus kowalevskii TaxID=10224 RepID=A0ABM0MZL4_SACKO|nr:PREDICTED: sphingosine-1-phosphate lyase-like [Saccoglossus kowalevskii]